MNAARFTLTSTILAVALGLGLSFGATPAKAHCAGKHTGDHPHCDGGGGGPIQFTAELTGGAFVFGPVVVTANNRENVLRSGVDLNFDIDFSPAPGTWDQVFNTCTELLAQDSVDEFFVGEDDWQIDRSGGVRVRLHDIMLQGAEVIVQLIGEEFDFLGDPFLPENPGETSVFHLTQFKINGRSQMGGPGGSQGCQPPSGGTADIFPLLVSSELTITAE